MTEDLLKTSEAAKRLGISQGTLRGYADKGMIPVVKLPSGHRRFRPSDVEDVRRKMGLDIEEEPWRRVADSGEAAWYEEIERGKGPKHRDDDGELQVDRTAE